MSYLTDLKADLARGMLVDRVAWAKVLDIAIAQDAALLIIRELAEDGIKSAKKTDAELIAAKKLISAFCMLKKCCTNTSWHGEQNGDGEDIGAEIVAALKSYNEVPYYE